MHVVPLTSHSNDVISSSILLSHDHNKECAGKKTPKLLVSGWHWDVIHQTIKNNKCVLGFQLTRDESLTVLGTLSFVSSVSNSTYLWHASVLDSHTLSLATVSHIQVHCQHTVQKQCALWEVRAKSGCTPLNELVLKHCPIMRRTLDVVSDCCWL